MKIGILTQPLFTNYGGILQAYALQTILKSMGHEVEVIRRDPPQLSLRFPNNFVLDFKYCLRRLLRVESSTRSARQSKLISRNTSLFIDKYIQTTKSLYTDSQLKNYIATHSFDIYVVGSDQVWRPAMSPNIYNFYLDFLKDRKVKRVAYAASFGVDSWEYTEEQMKVCRQLARKFDAISVRESSGIELCNKYLGVSATHVLDPTLLIAAADYKCLVIAENEPKCNGDLFCYILNGSDETMSCVNMIKQATGFTDFYCMPEYIDTPQNIEKHKQRCVFPPVTQWLRSFMDAKMVFTDSFHGMAFSIIFNKPFWVLGNAQRGMSRFESLLGLFELQKRLITPERIDSIDWNEPIGWAKVNERKSVLQKQSLSFLETNLSL